MRKAFLFVFLLASCTTSPPPRFSEEVSQVVYATHDSIEQARIELAKEYSDQSVRLITPPKHRIPIKPIIISCPPTIPGNKSVEKRMVIVPADYGTDEVVVVGSKEYEELMDKVNLANQLKDDIVTLQKIKDDVDKALIAERERNLQLEMDYNNTKLKLKDVENSLLKRNILLAGLGLLIGVYAYLRITKIIPFI